MNDRQPWLEKDFRADRELDRRFPNPKAQLGLEPLAPVLDEVDDRDRRPTSPRGQPDEVVELGLGWGIQDSVSAQRGKPFALRPGGTINFIRHGRHLQTTK